MAVILLLYGNSLNTFHLLALPWTLLLSTSVNNVIKFLFSSLYFSPWRVLLRDITFSGTQLYRIRHNYMESDTTSKIDTIDNGMDVEYGQEHNSNFKFV